jgi:hypothetical protein
LGTLFTSIFETRGYLEAKEGLGEVKQITRVKRREKRREESGWIQEEELLLH